MVYISTKWVVHLYLHLFIFCFNLSMIHVLFRDLSLQIWSSNICWVNTDHIPHLRHSLWIINAVYLNMQISLVVCVCVCGRSCQFLLMYPACITSMMSVTGSDRTLFSQVLKYLHEIRSRVSRDQADYEETHTHTHTQTDK